MSRYHALRFTAYSFSFINNQRTNLNVIRQTVLDRPEDGWPIRDTATATAQQDNEEFQCFYDHVGGLHVGILQEVNPLIEAAWYGPTQTSGVYIRFPFRLWFYGVGGLEVNVTLVGTSGMANAYTRFELKIEGAVA